MKITKEWLKKHNACRESIKEFEQQSESDSLELINFMIGKNDYKYVEWSNWLITRIMTLEERIKYAIYAAESVLHIFELRFPGDDRPRKAIMAAKDYLKCKNTTAAHAAARAAYATARAAYATARAAAYAAAAHAAYTAAYAAYAAASAAAYDTACDAYVAAGAAAGAAAAHAAYTAAAAAAAKIKKLKEIINYGISIISKI